LRWLPGLLFAVLLLAVLRRFSHFLVMPGMLVGAIGAFYLLLWISGLSVAEASAQGWMLGPFPSGALWQPLSPAAHAQVHWPLVLGQLGSLGTIVIISVVSLLLNASGVELSVRRDVDLNRELHAAGLANLVSGLGSGTTGYQTLSISALGPKLGAYSRLVGLTAALICGATVWFGAAVVSYFPKPVLGGLLMFLGLAFLVEWVYDAWFKFSKVEYLIVISILVAIGAIGVLEGVGIGIALAVVLFVFEYSRVSVVKHTLSGANFHSNVERPPVYRQLLRQKGDWLYILQLNGMLFFGTANKLLDQVRQRLKDPARPAPRYIVLDFSQVSGLDASAVLSFARMKQVAQASQVLLVFTDTHRAMQHKLGEVLAAPAFCRSFPPLDHGVEWCEDQLIKVFESVGVVASRRSVKQQLEAFLPKSGQFAGLMAFLDEESQAQPEEGQKMPGSVTRLQKYLLRQDVAAGDVLIRQGESARGVYFIESGQATVQLETQGPPVRIRKIGAGTVFGEMGFYLGTDATASVLIEEPGVVYRLSADSLKQMELDDPALAAGFPNSSPKSCASGCSPPPIWPRRCWRNLSENHSP
jgi:SulP family sulfate permease